MKVGDVRVGTGKHGHVTGGDRSSRKSTDITATPRQPLQLVDGFWEIRRSRPCRRRGYLFIVDRKKGHDHNRKFNLYAVEVEERPWEHTALLMLDRLNVGANELIEFAKGKLDSHT